MTKTKSQKLRAAAARAAAKAPPSKQRPTVSGHGAYKLAPSSSLKQLGNESVGSAAGRAAGQLFGAPAAGAMLGDLAHRLFKTVTGRGTYQVKMAAIHDWYEGAKGRSLNGSSILSGNLPMFSARNAPEGATPLVNEEYICDIKGSVGFRNQSFRINLGNKDLFGWCHPFSTMFEQYELGGLMFQFRSTSGSNSTYSPSMGVVCLSTQPNSSSPPPTSMRAALDNSLTTSNKPDRDTLHWVECARAQNPTSIKYIRDYGAPEFDDDLSDYGNFNISTDGMPVNDQVIGELWITYQVYAYRPKLAIDNSPEQYHGTFSWTGDDANKFANLTPSFGSTMQIGTPYPSVLALPSDTPRTVCLIMSLSIPTLPSGTPITFNLPYLGGADGCSLVPFMQNATGQMSGGGPLTVPGVPTSPDIPNVYANQYLSVYYIDIPADGTLATISLTGFNSVGYQVLGDITIFSFNRTIGKSLWTYQHPRFSDERKLAHLLVANYKAGASAPAISNALDAASKAAGSGPRPATSPSSAPFPVASPAAGASPASEGGRAQAPMARASTTTSGAPEDPTNEDEDYIGAAAITAAAAVRSEPALASSMPQAVYQYLRAMSPTR